MVFFCRVIFFRPNTHKSRSISITSREKNVALRGDLVYDDLCKTVLCSQASIRSDHFICGTSIWKMQPRDPTRLRISEFFSVYIADFWQTSWVIWENGSNWSNLRPKMSFFALGRLKNHKVPHLHPNSTMFMPLDRLQLKIYAFSGKFNVCSKRVLLLWIKICRDFTLQTQIFTQKYMRWLRFYSKFLRKKLAAGGSADDAGLRMMKLQHKPIDLA